MPSQSTRHLAREEVPEIDLVVTADPECLERQLQGKGFACLRERM